MIRTLTGLSAALIALATGAAAAPSTVRGGSPAGYEWPLRPAPNQIVRDFDPPPKPWLAGNRGLDLGGHVGQAVHASNSGIVTFAGLVGGVGAVAITFGALRTTYEPVTPTVHRGQRVNAGQVIGHLDAEALHWGLLRGRDYLDPLALLGLLRVRLLPLG
ncbi:MAG TPA: peptidoglycan DD-metalloendopeptidase family protein [Mycobacteriales bacterium]|nr:peptidoglycan DD-metalloendopeptidase family protein [Mycobacteriales bacterium]